MLARAELALALGSESLKVKLPLSIPGRTTTLLLFVSMVSALRCLGPAVCGALAIAGSAGIGSAKGLAFVMSSKEGNGPVVGG